MTVKLVGKAISEYQRLCANKSLKWRASKLSEELSELVHASGALAGAVACEEDEDVVALHYAQLCEELGDVIASVALLAPSNSRFFQYLLKCMVRKWSSPHKGQSSLVSWQDLKVVGTPTVWGVAVNKADGHPRWIAVILQWKVIDAEAYDRGLKQYTVKKWRMNFKWNEKIGQYEPTSWSDKSTATEQLSNHPAWEEVRVPSIVGRVLPLTRMFASMVRIGAIPPTDSLTSNE